MRNIKKVKVGNCVFGGEKIYVQSMLNRRSDDIEGSVEQAEELQKAGCDIIRAAIPDMDAVKLIPAIKEKVGIPLVADIHFDYKLALAAAEAGTERMGIIKSAVGIGSLLADGIGETIRVSLTGDPLKEVSAAKDILKAVGKGSGVELVSCPTCGRTRIDLVRAASMIEDAVRDIDKNVKVAVMGCVVNGPGEAMEADIGIAGGDKCAVIFKKGKVLRKISEDEIVPELLKEIEKL